MAIIPEKASYSQSTLIKQMKKERYLNFFFLKLQQQLISMDSFEAIEVRSETKRHKHIFNWSDQNEKGDMQHLNTIESGQKLTSLIRIWIGYEERMILI